MRIRLSVVHPLVCSLFLCSLQASVAAQVLDPGFIHGQGFTGSVRDVVLQPDGKILCAGGMGSYFGEVCENVVRLNADGSRDTTFSPQLMHPDIIQSMVLQPDGRVVLGSQVPVSSGHTGIARLMPNGDVDTSFDVGTGFDGEVRCVVLQPDGKILVSGGFDTYQGELAHRMARLNADGSLDMTFSVGTGFGPDSFTMGPLTMAVLPDGKILCGGTFTTVNGLFLPRIARLNPDGSVDNTFFVGQGFNGAVEDIALQSDGRIVVSGLFFMHDNTVRTHVARLLSSGLLDPSFELPDGTDLGVSDLVLAEDGTILIGGSFGLVSGQVRAGIARLLSDGGLDHGFDPPNAGFTYSLVNSLVWRMALQPDGKIVCGGGFHWYNNVEECGRIARLTMEDIHTAVPTAPTHTIQLFPNPVLNSLRVQGLPMNAAVEVRDAAGRQVLATRLQAHALDLSALAPGTYMLRSAGITGVFSARFVKE